MSEENPFEYVRPLPPGRVMGREELGDRLLRAVHERRLVALAGPRRYGKTSLLGQVAALATDIDGLDVVRLDCFGVASVGEFAVRLERAMSGLSGPARKLVRRLLESSQLGLSVAPGVGFKASFGRRDAPDAAAVLHELLGTLVELSVKRGGLLLVLDEFQDVGRVDGLDALLRSHLQEAREVAVLFAGSKPSMLRALFGDRARPFYGQAEIVEIERFDVATATSLVEEGFASTSRDAGDAAELVARAVAGHPQRLMLVAHLLWERVPTGGCADADDVGAALDVARDRTDAEQRAVLEGLDRTHRDTLRAVVAYGSPYARAAQRTLGLPRGSVQAAVRALEADALLLRREDSWSLVDPLLADWIRRQLPLPPA
jgi:uncharacterized protein